MYYGMMSRQPDYVMLTIAFVYFVTFMFVGGGIFYCYGFSIP
jgi:hypothetical protein